MSRAARLTVVKESGSVSKRHVEINGKDHARVQSESVLGSDERVEEVRPEVRCLAVLFQTDRG